MDGQPVEFQAHTQGGWVPGGNLEGAEGHASTGNAPGAHRSCAPGNHASAFFQVGSLARRSCRVTFGTFRFCRDWEKKSFERAHGGEHATLAGSLAQCKAASLAPAPVETPTCCLCLHGPPRRSLAVLQAAPSATDRRAGSEKQRRTYHGGQRREGIPLVAIFVSRIGRGCNDGHSNHRHSGRLSDVCHG